MLKNISKLFLDGEIGRREFMSRLVCTGVSVSGAAALAAQLTVQNANGGELLSEIVPEAGRTIKNATGGELIAEFLMDWDVPYVFGLAGSEEVGFLDALVDRTDLQYTISLHENTAMTMADGYSRSTGKTSVVQLHSVAGTAFALGQIISAYKDRIPVVITVGRQSTNFRGRDGFLEAPSLNELPKDYANWTWDVMNGVTIPEVMRRAFMLAEAPPGGPTFITFSKDLFETRVPETEIIPRSRSLVSKDIAPSIADVKAIVDHLLASKRPLIFLGNECIHYEISEEVSAICELVGAGVLFSMKIPTIFPNTHPNFIGEIMDDRALLGTIDCFWSLGGNMFKLFNRPSKPLLKRSTITMHTSLVESEIGRNYPVDVASIASLKTMTTMVLKELRSRDLSTPAIKVRQKWVTDYNVKRRAEFKKSAETEWNNMPIATSRLMIELNKVIDKSAYIVAELVTSDRFSRRYLDYDHTQDVAERRRNFSTTSGILGWGVGAAVGTKIGNPDKEVWCLIGDGSFNFGSQGLWSASRYEVPVGFVIFNNGQYQANRINSALLKGRMYETGKYIGVDIGHPAIDHVKLAGAYGVDGERVDDPDKIGEALARCKKAMAEGRSYLLDIMIEKRFEGKESEWYDFYSVAKGIPRQS